MYQVPERAECTGGGRGGGRTSAGHIGTTLSGMAGRLPGRLRPRVKWRKVARAYYNIFLILATIEYEMRPSLCGELR